MQVGDLHLFKWKGQNKTNTSCYDMKLSNVTTYYFNTL